MRRVNARVVVFVIVCVGLAVILFGYVWTTRSTPTAPVPVATADGAQIAAARSAPHLLVRHTGLDQGYGRLAVVALDAPDGPRVFTSLACERIGFAAGHGVCLAADRAMMTTYRADLLDDELGVRRSLPLTGVPSRTRVSADGIYSALTYFVNGDSYATGGFSTRTLLVQNRDGSVLANLEEFTITRDGKPFKAVDFNFWGVTFTREPGTFFATLSTGGTMYLIHGDAATRTARVVASDVECPSLSPDNRRIAYKRRMPGIRLHWQLHVLDLDTRHSTLLAETRSVDDQVEWLDDETLLYALPNQVQKAQASMDIWAVAADGTGEPRRLVTNAESPAVVRPTTRLDSAH
jgi:hypothetical protein